MTEIRQTYIFDFVYKENKFLCYQKKEKTKQQQQQQKESLATFSFFHFSSFSNQLVESNYINNIINIKTPHHQNHQMELVNNNDHHSPLTQLNQSMESVNNLSDEEVGGLHFSIYKLLLFICLLSNKLPANFPFFLLLLKGANTITVKWSPHSVLCVCVCFDSNTLSSLSTLSQLFGHLNNFLGF